MQSGDGTPPPPAWGVIGSSLSPLQEGPTEAKAGCKGGWMDLSQQFTVSQETGLLLSCQGRNRLDRENKGRCAAGPEGRLAVGSAPCGPGRDPGPPGGWAAHVQIPIHPLNTQDPKGNYTLLFQTWHWRPEPRGCASIKLHQSTL